RGRPNLPASRSLARVLPAADRPGSGLCRTGNAPDWPQALAPGRRAAERPAAMGRGCGEYGPAPLPAKWIYDRMELRPMAEDGAFTDAIGKFVVCDPSRDGGWSRSAARQQERASGLPISA